MSIQSQAEYPFLKTCEGILVLSLFCGTGVPACGSSNLRNRLTTHKKHCISAKDNPDSSYYYYYPRYEYFTG
jgi:hypothetical protein